MSEIQCDVDHRHGADGYAGDVVVVNRLLDIKWAA